MSHQQAPPDDWRHTARTLEAADRLQEAETLIAERIPDPHFALVIAELYADRYRRLSAQNDIGGATSALEQAERWANFFAAQATSGGEGTAFALERDRFLAGLRCPPSHPVIAPEP